MLEYLFVSEPNFLSMIIIDQNWSWFMIVSGRLNKKHTFYYNIYLDIFWYRWSLAFTGLRSLTKLISHHPLCAQFLYTNVFSFIFLMPWYTLYRSLQHYLKHIKSIHVSPSRWLTKEITSITKHQTQFISHPTWKYPLFPPPAPLSEPFLNGLLPCLLRMCLVLGELNSLKYET